MNTPAKISEAFETPALLERRLTTERDMLEAAEASVAAGRLIDSAEINAWIDSLGTDHELPAPTARN